MSAPAPMTALAASIALPAAAAAILVLLRTPVASRLVASPRGDRWHGGESTPLLGGTGIFAGVLAGVGLAVATGAVPASRELGGILAGAALLYLAGLVDDLRHLNPVTKLGAQCAAAAIALATGLKVEIVHSDVLAAGLAVVWLVGMTNAFNLLDNMDGLAAMLAAVAAAVFAIDAVTIHPSHTVLALALSLCLACVGFLPFNLRPGKRAATFMGDSGSQMLGFLLATFGLASSWKVAGTTVATLLLPILILAVPILDTTLVTVIRLLEGRPIYQGGRDHTSHRLVGRGLSESRAVILLALVAAGLGGTSLAYSVLNDGRITLLGVLITFALLVQFGSFLAEAERGGGVPRKLLVRPRRLVEVMIDFALISAAFAAAYSLTVGKGLPWDRHMATVSLPAILFARYVAFIPFGLYRGVWRYAGARDAVNVVLAVAVSELAAFVFIDMTQIWNGFPKTIFVVDALFAILFVGASRFAERFLERGLAQLRDRSGRRRTLIVGAGRGGRSLMRELRETPGEQVVGFVDDDVSLRHRRLQGVPVLGGIDEIGWVLGRSEPEAVLVTIPNAPRERLDAVIEACSRAGIPCGFVRREVELDPRVVLGTAGK